MPRWSAQSQLLLYMEQTSLFHSLNFSFLPWANDPDYGRQNQTAISTKVDLFLCPSDSDQIIETFGLAHNNYRASAGTLPVNLPTDSPDKSGRNDGAFWFQSAVRPAMIRDGSSTTALFSERCTGRPDAPDIRADYYQSEPLVSSCARAGPKVSPRFVSPVEWSGERWGDGNVFYTRYQHVLTPNRPSCILGGNEDFDSPVLSTATSRHPGGVNLLRADGSARFVGDSIAPAVWRALGTIAGRETVGDP